MDLEPVSLSSPLAVVVNDDPIQLAVLAGLLAKAGMEPRAFTSAAAALSEVSDRAAGADGGPVAPPALVVTDLYMPGIDGWRFCRLLRSPEYAAFNSVPILVVSATFSGEEVSGIAADLGAEAFLPSPVDGRRFVEQVRAIVEGRRVRRPLRVLVVEDCKALAGMLADVFEASGYRADSAPTARAAAEAFGRTTYDVAVLDYELPDGTGDALLDAYRSERPDCVCVMMTSDPEPGLALDWMKRGAAAYLRKPFDPAYLVELCAQARRERSLLRVQDLLEARTRELRESEANLREAQEIARLGRWELYLATGQFALSDGFLALFEADRGAFSASYDALLDAVHPLDRARVERLYAESIVNKKPYEVDGVDRVPRHVVADEQKLRQVLINLLGNAVKFTDAGGIRLRAWAEATGREAAENLRLVVQVEDTGPGIGAGEVGRLFDAFEQASLGRRTGQGTGLGLALSRQLARLMGGDVSLVGGSGDGAVFRLEIPFEKGGAEVAVGKADACQVLRVEGGHSTFKVLVVDDYGDSRSFLTQLLGGAGFDVCEADGGRRAVAVFSEWHPHVVLMDKRMSGMDGDEAIRLIRRSPGGGETRIITMTSSATEETREQTFEAGADDFMVKPFRQSELFEKIRLLTGLRYVYAEPAQPELAAPGRTSALAKEALSAIPDELKGQLREAAIRGRHGHLLKLVQQVDTIDPEVGGQLREIVTKFDYDTLNGLFS